MSTDNQLIEGDKNAYSSTAEMHADKHPFPVGRWFAENLGCPSELLDSLQSSAVDVFTGVSNVSVFAEIPI